MDTLTSSWTTIHASLSFFALAMTIISFWVKRSAWTWGGFLVFALVLGYFAGIITPIALAPIGALLVLHALMQSEVRGLVRFVLFAATVAISIGLLGHYFPGFHNIPIYQKIKISPDAVASSLWLNFDKPFIGIFVLAWGLPLMKSVSDFERLLKVALPFAIGGIAIMIYFSLFSDLIHWDPKFTPRFWIFAIINLIFVTVIEEAFFRGFFQNELLRWLGGKGYLANVGSVFLTALAFALLHFQWVANPYFLALVFIAGIIYGSIYQFTKAIEASILCHWLLNITHFALFTYPVLRSAI